MKSGQITKRPSIEEHPEFLFHHCNKVVFNTLNGDFQISTIFFAYFPMCRFTHINVLESIPFTSMS